VSLIAIGLACLRNAFEEMASSDTIDGVRFCHWYNSGMEENPYQAPVSAENHVASSNSVAPRWAVAMMIVFGLMATVPGVLLISYALGYWLWKKIS
jgi:hypothetical protein